MGLSINSALRYCQLSRIYDYRSEINPRHFQMRYMIFLFCFHLIGPHARLTILFDQHCHHHWYYQSVLEKPERDFTTIIVLCHLRYGLTSNQCNKLYTSSIGSRVIHQVLWSGGGGLFRMSVFLWILQMNKS